MVRCKPLCSLNSFLSYAPQLSGVSPVHLASCIPPAPQQTTVGGSIPWITVLGALIHIWMPEIQWWLWHFLLISTAGDIFISQYYNDGFIIVWSEWSEGAQSCQTLWSHEQEPVRLLCPWDFPAKILNYQVAISFSRGSSQPKDWTHVSCIAGRLLTGWAMKEVLL